MDKKKDKSWLFKKYEEYKKWEKSKYDKTKVKDEHKNKTYQTREYKDGGIAEPNAWDRFKEGFKPKVKRIKDEQARKTEKDYKRHMSNTNVKRKALEYLRKKK
jgi:hypothetical protein